MFACLSLLFVIVSNKLILSPFLSYCFFVSLSDPIKDQPSGDTGFERQFTESSVPVVNQFEIDSSVTNSQQVDYVPHYCRIKPLFCTSHFLVCMWNLNDKLQDIPSSSSKNLKIRFKVTNDFISSAQPIAVEFQHFPAKEQVSGDDTFAKKPAEPSMLSVSQVQRDFGAPHIQEVDYFLSWLCIHFFVFG